jgi:hypothetical protein
LYTRAAAAGARSFGSSLRNAQSVSARCAHVSAAASVVEAGCRPSWGNRGLLCTYARTAATSSGDEGGGGSSGGWVSRPPEGTPEAIVLVTSGAESDNGPRRVGRAVPRQGLARTAGASSRRRDAWGVARAETRRVVADATCMSDCEAGTVVVSQVEL